jgi:mannose-6-phosphate isomerase-like protein (cupin superfamily)
MKQKLKGFTYNGIKMKKYTIQKSPFVVPTNDGKLIEEHFGNATDGNSNISIAHMIAPPGWSEPFQTPGFDEYTYIIKGKKQFIIDGDTVVLNAGESIKIEKNTRVQYSNPFVEPCEYLAICTPAFSMDLVNRESE